MGHMNTRFYVARCNDAVTVLFAMVGVPAASMRIGEIHIRFHREAYASALLHMTAGFGRMGDDDAELVLCLWHSADDKLAATFRVRVRCVSGSWPRDALDRAAAMAVEMPPEAAPRSIGTGMIEQRPADLSRYTRIAISVINAADCDHHGRMLPQKLIGAVSDGVRQLTAPLRDIAAKHADPKPTKLGGAVLETRLVYIDWPRAGDCFQIHSGFTGADSRTMSLDHWLTDLQSGKLLGYVESVAVVFDLERRKIVGITDAARDEMRPLQMG